MIVKVLRGTRATGLLKYLFGPGEHNEHVNPRVIAGWDGYPTPDVVDGRADHRQLGALLDSTWRMAGMGPDDKPVYHASVSLAKAVPEDGLAADPHISDAQFREVAEAMVRSAGLSPCRWVAVRHDVEGATHAHIVATLATESGRRWHPVRLDFHRLGDVCREYEVKWDLRRTAPRTAATPKRETSQEQRKAARNGWSRSTRVVLRERVRAVAGRSESLEQFFSGLRADGLLVKERLSPRDGSVTGYAVAGRRTEADGQVEELWFSGGKLSADLTVPRLRERWPDSHAAVSGPPPLDRDDVWRQAVASAAEAVRRVRGHNGNPAAARSAALEASDFVASCARIVPGREGLLLRSAAAGF